MKHTSILSPILIPILALAACGGSKPPPAEPKEPEPEAEAKPEPAPEAKPAPEPEPAPEPTPAPPPKTTFAIAQMVPAKGSRIKGTAVTLTQTEGGAVTVASNGWFDGLKAGKYHLLVHDGADCGPNGSKAGKPMASADIPFTAAKGQTALDVGEVSSIQLAGDAAVVGHALVLHDDKKGKPGKALACGPIKVAGG
jgi:hypothetical protein